MKLLKPEEFTVKDFDILENVLKRTCAGAHYFVLLNIFSEQFYLIMN